jgi:hypothetical protein
MRLAMAHAAAFVEAAGGADVIVERFPFLNTLLDEMRAFGLSAGSTNELRDTWRMNLDAWEERHAAPAWPLRRLLASGLSPAHLLALTLAGLVEVDARFGVLFAALHPFPEEQRLTVGLLDDILNAFEPAMSGWAAAHTLAERGALQVQRPDAPRAARPLSVPGPIWDALGERRAASPSPGLRLHEADSFPGLGELGDWLPEEIVTRLARAPRLLTSGLVGGVVLRGMQGSGRLRALGALAREMNAGLLVIARPDVSQLPDLCRMAGPLATLLGALPVVNLELAPGENLTLPPLIGYNGPIGVIVGAEGGVQGEHAERCVTLRLPPARQDARYRHWERAVGHRASPAFLDTVSRTFHLTIGGVERAGRLAQAYAGLDGRDDLRLSDVQAACRALNRQSLEALATPIETQGYGWDSLVVSDSTQAELRSLVMRCRQREAVLARLGPGFGQANRGVRALFGGSSGMGKTLAARIVVAELGLDLYRVDLAAIVNKYIGETERNLSRLFARAEEQDIVLLLDEGDSLLTSRTDVRTSNDRYANMETNYLLQRLEHYEGILLITTNAAGRIDDAFQRRLDAHVEFAAPTPAQRYDIWRLHLPPEHAVDEAYLRLVAARCDLSGGQIRNAALHASVLAVEHGQPVQPAFLAGAIAREYRKLGANSPLVFEMP